MIIKYIKIIRNLIIKIFIFKRYKIGKNFYCGKNVKMWAKNFIEIGNNFYIGRFSQICCDAKIGDNVIIADNVSLIGKYDHNYKEIGKTIRLSSQIRDKDYSWKGKDLAINIEDDVWIGCGSILLSGIKIGSGSIIAAGSIVTKDVCKYSIVAGNPAKIIGFRFNDEEIVEHEKIIRG